MKRGMFNSSGYSNKNITPGTHLTSRIGRQIKLFTLAYMFHQAFTLVHLAGGQFVAATLKWIVTCFEFNPYRRTTKVQYLAEGVDEVALIGDRHALSLIAMDNNNRRVLSTLVGIT